jgi:hypothetical protein
MWYMHICRNIWFGISEPLKRIWPRQKYNIGVDHREMDMNQSGLGFMKIILKVHIA